jgi:putative ABC transport system permease protein
VSPLFLDLRLDWRVLAFATSLALGTCVLFGLAPARRASAVAPTTNLKNAARGLTKRGSTLRRALVVTQIALALALLSGGLLFARTLFNLLTIDAGFQSAGVLETDVDFGRLQLPPEERAPARRALLDRLQAIPGVRSAATTSTVPLVSNWQQAVYLDTPADQGKAFTRFNRVSARYFETMGTTIVSGRDFAAQDTPSSPRVAVVTEAFVRTFLHGRHAVGARFRVQGTPGRPDPTLEIVGVVADSKYETLRESPKPIVFLAESQLKAPGTWANVMIRSDVPIASLMAAVKQAVEADFPRLAFHFHDLEEQVEHSLLQERLMAVLCGFFAALAAVLATIGVYGVIAYSVAERTGEIGIRLVLGAGSREVLHLVLREAALMVTIGLIAGLGLALSLARFAGALLFGVEPQDPITLGAAIAILAVVAIAASYLPAWRASRLNPLAALRAE